jgi:predicted component of type VI protein secretion system
LRTEHLFVHTDAMAGHLKPHEFESLRRSAAMGGLTPRSIAELVVSHQALLEERAELRALVARMGPTWTDHRAALNELAQRLSDEERAPADATEHDDARPEGP